MDEVLETRITHYVWIEVSFPSHPESEAVVIHGPSHGETQADAERAAMDMILESRDEYLKTDPTTPMPTVRALTIDDPRVTELMELRRLH